MMITLTLPTCQHKLHLPLLDRVDAIYIYPRLKPEPRITQISSYNLLSNFFPLISTTRSSHFFRTQTFSRQVTSCCQLPILNHCYIFTYTLHSPTPVPHDLSPDPARAAQQRRRQSSTSPNPLHYRRLDLSPSSTTVAQIVLSL